MTNFTENNNGSSSSSPTPSEVPRDFDVFEDFYANGNWSPNNGDIGVEVDNHSSSEDEKGCFLYLILIIFSVCL